MASEKAKKFEKYSNERKTSISVTFLSRSVLIISLPFYPGIVTEIPKFQINVLLLAVRIATAL